MFYVIIVLVIILDQLTKLFVHQNMVLNSSLPVIDGIFSITYIQNTGAAFSFLEGMTSLLIGVQVIVIVGILAYMVRKGLSHHWVFRTSMALILGGGVGNLIDRAVNGYVVDFLNFHFWPIFNVADIAVCVGCGLLMLYVFLIEGKEKNGKKI